jgi:glycosyltransferase involved in cell wall biosynthesis
MMGETTLRSPRPASAPPLAPRTVDDTDGLHESIAAHRKLLMITFYYPPSNSSSGGLRPLKFSKYLREFGWDSTVLTVRESCHDSTDNALLQDIPPWVGVHRTRCFDAKKAFGIRGSYPAFLAVPDRYVSWLPFGVRRAVRAVRCEHIDALFSTSPIPTAHLIALVAKLKTRVPWVADFRDPWVETEGSEVRGRFRQSVELWLEGQVVRHADRILVTTVESTEYFCGRYGDAISRKIHAVYNGYDEDDFSVLTTPDTTEERFTIVHTGLLDPNYRNPEPFLRAVRQCIDRGALPPSVSIRLIGGSAYATSQTVVELLADLHLQNVVRTEQRLPYAQALAALAGASALLLLQGGDDTRISIPAKAFEYLRVGRPTLTLAPNDSATARLMRQFAGSFVADPNDPKDIAEKLSAIFLAWSGGARVVDRSQDDVSRYSRRAAAAELAKILSGAVGQVQ